MGYDPRATNLPKSVKRVAARIQNNDARRSLVKSYIEAERSIINSKGARNRKAS